MDSTHGSLNSATLFLPAALTANRDWQSGGERLGEAQLYFLKPRASKVFLALRNQRQAEFVMSVEYLAKLARLSPRSVHRALDELRDNRLIQTTEERHTGQVAGLRFRLLAAPASLPKIVAETERKALIRRQESLEEQLSAVNHDLDLLDELTMSSRGKTRSISIQVEHQQNPATDTRFEALAAPTEPSAEDAEVDGIAPLTINFVAQRDESQAESLVAHEGEVLPI